MSEAQPGQRQKLPQSSQNPPNPPDYSNLPHLTSTNIPSLDTTHSSNINPTTLPAHSSGAAAALATSNLSTDDAPGISSQPPPSPVIMSRKISPPRSSTSQAPAGTNATPTTTTTTTSARASRPNYIPITPVVNGLFGTISLTPSPAMGDEIFFDASPGLGASAGGSVIIASPLISPPLSGYFTAPTTPLISPGVEDASMSTETSAPAISVYISTSSASEYPFTISPSGAISPMSPSTTQPHISLGSAASSNYPTATIAANVAAQQASSESTSASGMTALDAGGTETFPSSPSPSDPESSGLSLDDDSLSPLEKIYLFARSEAAYHRIFIAHALPTLMSSVSPSEAVEYVLPLLSGLAMDEDEKVKEALAAEIGNLMWWFFSHCRIVPDESSASPFGGGGNGGNGNGSPTLLSVQAFTPILGTLLLSSNALVGGPARYAVVETLKRMRRADEHDHGLALSPVSAASSSSSPAPSQRRASSSAGSSISDDVFYGLFGMEERRMFEDEIIHSVVIGLGRLDDNDEDDTGHINNNGNPPTTQTTTTATTHATGRSSADPVSAASGTDATGSSGEGDDEQAAVGRLSSMSLMAAVTAGGTLNEDVLRMFVAELEHISHDDIYWVRREASFALGALAKVVPEELVTTHLVPLFNSLRTDAVWHVRHSALFALPTILARLKPDARRQLASSALIALARDDNPSVRSGVLEALGEVIYTFHDTPGSVPSDLLGLFIGRVGPGFGDVSANMSDPTTGAAATAQEQHLPYLPIPRRRVSDKLVPPPPPLSPSTSTLLRDPSLDAFFSDTSRALICAFNMPAVALTLGKERWPALRELYVKLQRDRAVLVRRTLAASVGELARIVGPQFTRLDLVGTWWDALHCEDDADVRLKAVESTALLMEVLSEKEVAASGAPGGSVQPLFLNSPSAVAQALATVWEEGCLRGWRERETVLGLLELVAQKASVGLMEKLLWKGLEDRVAAVREVAIKTVPHVWSRFSRSPADLSRLHQQLKIFASSSSYQKRMTYVACQESLLFPERETSILALDDEFWHTLIVLASDRVEGVRIGVARLVSALNGRSLSQGSSGDSSLSQLRRHLMQDSATEVRAYLLNPTPNAIYPRPARRSSSRGSLGASQNGVDLQVSATFSRPPSRASNTPS